MSAIYASGIDLDGDDNSILYNTVINSGRQAVMVTGDQNEDLGFNNFFNGMPLSRDGAEVYACSISTMGTAALRRTRTYCGTTTSITFLVHGATTSSPNNNRIANNSIPDSSTEGRLEVVYVESCATTSVIDNKLVVNVRLDSNGTACHVVNNGPHPPGATEMSPSTQVGCHFSGCSSNKPPEILSDGDVTPCPAFGTN